MSLRCVIFDFDGLMVDTESAEYFSWSELYKSHGQVLEREIWAQTVGTRDAFDLSLHLETLAGVALDREGLRAARTATYLEVRQTLVLLDGVRDRIEEAQSLGLKLGIASSSERRWIDDHLERFDLLRYFDCISCFGDGLPAKPAPVLYVACLRGLGCQANEALAFEDSPNGIAAAKAAGIYCIAVPNEMTSALDLSAADLIVPSLADISLTRMASEWPSA
jgi:HAD superfamily hydrolase (TIGR01509 family)